MCAEGEHLVHAVVQRQRDPVARRLDLLDRLEPRGVDRGHEPGVRGRDLGVRGHDIDAGRGQGVAHRDLAGGERGPVRTDRRRASRDVRAAAPDERPPAFQAQHPGPVLEHEVPRPPAGRTPVLGPGPRLVDVPARRIDGPGVPVVELGGDRLARRAQSAAPEIPRRRSHPIARDATAPSGPVP